MFLMKTLWAMAVSLSVGLDTCGGLIMFFSNKKKVKETYQIDIGKQTGKIWFKDLLGNAVFKDVTVVGAYVEIHRGDFYIKKASIESMLEKAYEKGFLALDDSGMTLCIPTSQILEVKIYPIQEHIVTHNG